MATCNLWQRCSSVTRRDVLADALAASCWVRFRLTRAPLVTTRLVSLKPIHSTTLGFYQRTLQAGRAIAVIPMVVDTRIFAQPAQPA